MTCARTKGHQLKLLGTRCRTASKGIVLHTEGKSVKVFAKNMAHLRNWHGFIGRSGKVLNREVNWSLPNKLLYVQVQGEDICRLSSGANILHVYPALTLLKEATCEQSWRQDTKLNRPLVWIPTAIVIFLRSMLYIREENSLSQSKAR